ncbi:branched-chain amino acid ABC transporter permease [Enterovirga sp. CN4-39]|uniref:branched-chain amino acid ABC transporter permease n=1 Tax=Enterovirga sp. CN4-39 TaxID=3400910 RepID=UPI003C0B6A7C
MASLLSARGFLVLVFGLLAVVPFVANPYMLYVTNVALIYIILAIGLNILIGYAGQIAFANAAMFGIGAYAAGLLQVRLGLPYWLALPSAGLVAMLIGTVISWPALRLSGIHLALATLAFAQFTQWVFLNAEWLTFGATGFTVPRLNFAPLPVTAPQGIYGLSWVVALALTLVAWNVVHSRIGRALVSMRDNEVAAAALGVDLFRYKVIAFAISGFYAGIAGGLFCGLLNYVAPESYDLFQMVIQKAMVVVGGVGSIAGSVIGALLLVAMLEGLREFKSLQEIAFGVVLLGFVLFMPLGVVSLARRYWPGWREDLHRRDAPEEASAAPAIAPAQLGVAQERP